MDKIKTDYDNTVQLLLPFVREQKGQVFFKVVSPIEENEHIKLSAVILSIIIHYLQFIKCRRQPPRGHVSRSPGL
jgi:hypothetical protein